MLVLLRRVPHKEPYERLEPCEGKLSRTVLRGGIGSNADLLPDHDTIANNLRIAKLDATQAELEEACRKASVHDFIVSLPQGYDTPVAELGDSLSGGERQRLGLARAFLHQAPLLLLDEPTSNLDSLNEAVILRSLQQVKGEQTIVLVSHRQSTMGIVEQQYCVEQGRVS